MASRRGWMGAVTANPVVAGLLSLSLAIALVGIGIAINRSGNDQGTPIAVASQPGPGESPVSPGVIPSASAGASLPAPSLTASPIPTSPPTGVGVPTLGPTKGPGTRPVACSPRQPKLPNGQPETGITNSTVKIGQIISDSSNLPQQLHPVYEGLSAYVKRVNDAGGVCKRKIDIVYENDNALPATHRFDQLADDVFAFVANESLIESTDYGTQPPFNPVYGDDRTGQFVPDIGGLSFSYQRSQSQWYAGAIGSISPLLIGGGVFHAILENVRAAGHPCRLNGIIYLIEPTGSSEDQAELLRIVLEAPWGGRMPGKVLKYQTALAQPVEVHRGTVQRMIRDGVDCVWMYMDLQSNISFVIAMKQEGIWPPGACTRSNKNQCFDLGVQPLASYDPRFIRDVEASAPGASRGITTFVPTLPFNETSNPAMRRYIGDLRRCNAARYGGCRDAEPAFFSALGYVSGAMFVQGLRACGAAPTRICLMRYMKSLKGFTGEGLIGPVAPFKCTRARDNYSPGSHNYGAYCWKWIYTDNVVLRVLGNERDLIDRFHRIAPARGFLTDTLRIARGSPA